MTVPISSGSRLGLSCWGSFSAMISSHFGASIEGDSGMAIWGRSSGMPDAIPSKPSNFPMNTSFASLCSRICRIVSGVSVGYSGTETWPAIQMARSAMIHHAVFLEKIARCVFSGRPRERRWVAIRRTWSMASLKVNVFTSPPPMGWVIHRRSGLSFSHLYMRSRAVSWLMIHSPMVGGA